ncbi:MAG: tetratricopeptide (TPR) repeat protein [Pirellulaceae bacterium]
MLDVESKERLVGNVYDTWAKSKRREANWQGAIEVYTKGLSRHPNSLHLQRNAVVLWQNWARTYMDKKQWASAVDIYNQAVVQFPKEEGLQNNLRYCQQRLGKE